MKRFRGKKGMIILIVMVLMLAGYYFILSNRSKPAEEPETAVSDVQLLLLKDMEKNYPPSPKEVVKLFSKITKCYYEGKYTEDEFLRLAEQAKLLYDEELVTNKTEEEYLTDLRAEIKKFKELDCQVYSYTISPVVDIDFFEQDGFEFAKLYCVYSMRQKTKMYTAEYQFLLRKDEAGHYRIYGWEPAENKNESSE